MRYDRATAGYRAAVATEFRRDGMDYQAIADKLGYSNRSGAWKAVDRCLRQRRLEAADGLFETIGSDLAVIQPDLWRKALGGDVAAARVVLRLIELRLRTIARYSTAGEPS